MKDSGQREEMKEIEKVIQTVIISKELREKMLKRMWGWSTFIRGNRFKPELKQIFVEKYEECLNLYKLKLEDSGMKLSLMEEMWLSIGLSCPF